MTPYWSDPARGLTIYHGDCRDILPTFADGEFGSVICDPPYGIGFADWDIPPDSAILQQCLRVSEGSVVMFGARDPDKMARMASFGAEWMMPWLPTPPIQSWVTIHGMHMDWQPMWGWRLCDQHEFNSDVVRAGMKGRNDKALTTHPTMKPVGLIVRLLRAFGGRSTLDPYIGSGTTLVAAAKLGIPATGIEINEKYCKMAVCRLEGGFMDDEPAHLFNQEAQQ